MADDFVPKFDPTKKKKKKSTTKKPKPVAEDSSSSSAAVAPVEEVVAAPVAEPVVKPAPVETKAEEPSEEPVRSSNNDEEDDGVVDIDDDELLEKLDGLGLADQKGDDDYSYQELLDRVFDILESHNPELANSLGAKRKQVFTVPEVYRSTKRTIWHNFQQTCRTMNRPPEHFMTFILSELGTTGQLDGNKRLVVNGRFNPRQLENVEKNYIDEYITCKTCKTHDTTLKKENRLYFLQCRICGSQRTVAAVKAGFIAQVGRRKKA